MRKLQNALAPRAVDPFVPEIEQEEVEIGASRDGLVAQAGERGVECLGVVDDLLLVLNESWLLCLLQGHGEARDGVVVGAALVPREDREVDLFLPRAK